MYKLINSTFYPVLRTTFNVDTIFADPPDNIGLKYNDYKDQLTPEKYEEFLKDLVELSVNCAKTVYISFNAKWIPEMGRIAMKYREQLDVRFLMQGFTFGQHNKHDFGNNFRPIVRFRKQDAPLFPDNVRVESERMKIGDKRANPAGKVPGDVWRPDFLKYARVTGNSKQRRSWHPTQLHEGLIEDCLLMSTPKGGLVVDPFAGTGTTLRVCRANGWNCTTCDVDLDYCREIAREHKMHEYGTGLWHLTETKE